MTSSTPVLLSHTEAATRILQSTLQDALKEFRAPSRPSRIVRIEGFGPTDSRQVRAHGDYLRMVSLIEAFTDSVHGWIVGRESGGLSQVAHRALEEHLLSSTQSWWSREEAFRRVHGIRLSKSPRWQDLKGGAIEVRNAIAHGLGELTRKQLRNPSIRTQLGAVRVDLSGGRLRIGAESLSECAAIGQGYLYWLDSQVRR